MTTDTAAQPTTTLEQHQATRDALQARHDELVAEMATATRELEAARQALGEAIAAGADASSIHDRIRELETQADGLERAIEIVDQRRATNARQITAEQARLADEEAKRAHTAYRAAREALDVGLGEAAVNISRLYEAWRSAGQAANSAAGIAAAASGRKLAPLDFPWNGQLGHPDVTDAVNAIRKMPSRKASTQADSDVHRMRARELGEVTQTPTAA